MDFKKSKRLFGLDLYGIKIIFFGILLKVSWYKFFVFSKISNEDGILDDGTLAILSNFRNKRKNSLLMIVDAKEINSSVVMSRTSKLDLS